MKKLIDIPNEILQELKILAVKSNKDLKNFIQDLRRIIKAAKNPKSDRSAKKRYSGKSRSY